MAKTDSGIQSASRFLNFSWMYVVLATLLWLNMMLLVTTNESANFAPVYLVWDVVTGQPTDLAGLSVHSVFGFHVPWDDTPPAALLIFLLIAVSVGLYVVPQAGKTRYLPAVRSLHLRAKLTTAVMVGLFAAALIAFILEALQIDLVPLFTRLGWMPMITNWRSMQPLPSTDFRPTSGIISAISMLSLGISISLFGGAAFLSMSMSTLGRDRYWQTERWTLILTLMGGVLVLLSCPFMKDDSGFYSSHERYLGGCYTAWMTGWAMLTFAWTSRTALLLMTRKYEDAMVNSDEPNCFACGYDLRMLTSHQCPECGTVITEQRMKKIKRGTERAMASTHAESRSTTR